MNGNKRKSFKRSIENNAQVLLCNSRLHSYYYFAAENELMAVAMDKLPSLMLSRAHSPKLSGKQD